MRQYEYLVRFLLIGASVLTLAMALAYRFFPRSTITVWEALLELSASGKKDEPGFWQRMLDPGRVVPPRRGSTGFGKEKSLRNEQWRRVKSPAGSLTAPTVIDVSQIPLRETILAQLLLHDRFEISERKAWDTVRNTPGGGRFRDYEEHRFITEMMWIRYQDNRSDKHALKKLRQTAEKMVGLRTSFFEDYFNAGVTQLLNGDSAKALRYLQIADRDWPAKGRAYGNLYLALMIAHAVHGHGRAVLDMLTDFQKNYPDWLYVETFVPDLDDLKETYPDARLLDVVRGRLMQFVNNFAEANAFYQQALAGRGLESHIGSQVRRWFDETGPHHLDPD